MCATIGIMIYCLMVMITRYTTLEDINLTLEK